MKAAWPYLEVECTENISKYMHLGALSSLLPYCMKIIKSYSFATAFHAFLNIFPEQRRPADPGSVVCGLRIRSMDPNPAFFKIPTGQGVGVADPRHFCADPDPFLLDLKKIK